MASSREAAAGVANSHFATLEGCDRSETEWSECKGFGLGKDDREAVLKDAVEAAKALKSGSARGGTLKPSLGLVVAVAAMVRLDYFGPDSPLV